VRLTFRSSDPDGLSAAAEVQDGARSAWVCPPSDGAKKSDLLDRLNTRVTIAHGLHPDERSRDLTPSVPPVERSTDDARARKTIAACNVGRRELKVTLVLLCGLLLAGAALVPVPAAQGATPNITRTATHHTHLFDVPFGIAVDRRGNVYVTNGLPDPTTHAAPGPYRDTIVKLSPSGRVLARWGSPGTAPGQFTFPAAIALGGDDNIYVSEIGNNRIQKLSPTGKVLAVYGKAGSGPGEFKGPGGLAVDPFGDIWVADAHNNRVQELSPSGKALRMWGTLGSAPGQFQQPFGIALDKGGDVYVTDHINHRVQEFTSTGKFLRQWGHEGSGPGEFIGVSGIQVGRQGYVYVCESDINAMQKFKSDGKPVAMWTKVGFKEPLNVAINARDNLYVTNAFGNSVTKLSSTGHVLAVWK
jgi:sugar lactone lactonase YvrE